MTDEATHNTPRPMSHEQAAFLTELQGLEADFVAICNKMGKSRELSVAITHMETAAMWATRHLLGAK